MQKGAQEVVMDVVARAYIKGGPHLWVAQTLYKKGCLSSNKLWDEYVRDHQAKVDHKGNPSKDLIQSKSFLKERILKQMESQGKIEKARADDLP